MRNVSRHCNWRYVTEMRLKSFWMLPNFTGFSKALDKCNNTQTKHITYSNQHPITNILCNTTTVAFPSLPKCPSWPPYHASYLCQWPRRNPLALTGHRICRDQNTGTTTWLYFVRYFFGVVVSGASLSAGDGIVDVNWYLAITETNDADGSECDVDMSRNICGRRWSFYGIRKNVFGCFAARVSVWVRGRGELLLVMYFVMIWAHFIGGIQRVLWINVSSFSECDH